MEVQNQLLTCLLLTHQNKPIECICTAQKCKAENRIYCVICSSEQLHKDCKKQYKTKEDLITNFYSIIEHDSFILRKYTLIRDQLEQQLNLVNNTISTIQNISQSIQQNPQAAQSLIDAYNIITFNQEQAHLTQIIDLLAVNHAHLINHKYKIQPLMNQAQSTQVVQQIDNSQDNSQNNSEFTIRQAVVTQVIQQQNNISDQNVRAVEAQEQVKLQTSLNQTIIKTISRVCCLAQSSNHLVTCGHKGIIQIYESLTKKPIVQLSMDHIYINMLEFSPKGNYLAAVTNQKIVIWGTENWGCVYERSISKSWWFKNSIVSIQFSPDEQFILFNDTSNTHQIWNWKTNKRLYKQTCSKKLFQLSSDWKYLAVGCDHDVLITQLPIEDEQS